MVFVVLFQGKGSGTSMFVQSLRGDPFRVSFPIDAKAIEHNTITFLNKNPFDSIFLH